MPISKSRQNANRKWNDNNLERLYVTVRNGQKDKIKSEADKQGESLNSYIVNAVKQRMKRESGIDLGEPQK
jgi:predicted HicB family RNase H-like nuclease